MTEYRIIRFYADREPRREIIYEGLTFDEALAHCNDPETSSETATSPEARKHTAKYGPWFDGFEKED